MHQIFLIFIAISFLRNHLFDGTTTLPDGTKITKKDFNDLWRKLDNETMIHKLKPIHFTCKEMDRQNVKLATQVLSHTVSVLLKELFPVCRAKNSLAEYIDVIDSSFNILNSNQNEHENFTKKAFGGEHLADQLAVLDKFHDTISRTGFSGRPRFNTGLLICIEANIGLQDHLAKVFDLHQFKTRNTTQEI